MGTTDFYILIDVFTPNLKFTSTSLILEWSEVLCPILGVHSSYCLIKINPYITYQKKDQPSYLSFISTRNWHPGLYSILILLAVLSTNEAYHQIIGSFAWKVEFWIIPSCALSIFLYRWRNRIWCIMLQWEWISSAWLCIDLLPQDKNL